MIFKSESWPCDHEVGNPWRRDAKLSIIIHYVLDWKLFLDIILPNSLMPDLISDRAGFSQTELISHGSMCQSSTAWASTHCAIIFKYILCRLSCVCVCATWYPVKLRFTPANIAGFHSEIYSPSNQGLWIVRERKDNYFQKRLKLIHYDFVKIPIDYTMVKRLELWTYIWTINNFQSIKSC